VMYVRRRLGQLTFPSSSPSFFSDPIASYEALVAQEAANTSQWLWPSASGSLASGTAQIQSVPDNAAKANAAAVAAGLPAPYNIAAIQTAADQQTAAFQPENTALFAVSPLDPTTWPWYYWVGIGFALWYLKK